MTEENPLTTGKRSRKEFVKSASVLSLTGLSGIGAAQELEKPKKGAEDVGIKSKVNKSISEGDIEEARDLLSRNNVSNSLDTKERQIVSPTIETESSPKLKPQWHYKKSDCTLFSFIWRISGDLWQAHGGIEFNDDPDGYSWGLPQYLPDACALSFDNSEWSAPHPTEDGVTYVDNSSKKSIKHDRFYPSHGVTAKVIFNGQAQFSGSVAMHTQLVEINTGNKIPVQFHYTHTTSLAPGNISIGLAAGVLSVSTPLQGKKQWSDSIETEWYPQ
jgi:hypothetical protein